MAARRSLVDFAGKMWEDSPPQNLNHLEGFEQDAASVAIWKKKKKKVKEKRRGGGRKEEEAEEEEEEEKEKKKKKKKTIMKKKRKMKMKNKKREEEERQTSAVWSAKFFLTNFSRHSCFGFQV